MAAGNRTSRMRTACTPLLVLLLLVFLSSGGYGGGGVKASEGESLATETGRALAARRPTPEAQLRAALTSRTKTVLRLTSDVRLTSNLPSMTCTNLTVVGNCRTRGGRLRQCKIDGRKKFSGFKEGAEDTVVRSLQLTNLHLTNFRGPIVALAGVITVRNCFVTRNTAEGSLFSAYELEFEHSSFFGNNCTLIGGMYINVQLKGVVFRSNVGGPSISLYRGSVVGERCRFEASRGGAVEVSKGSVKFIRSSFVKNSGGAVHLGFDGMGDFCHCKFEGNYVTVGGRRKAVRHVYFGGIMDGSDGVRFCKKRPPVGVVLESPDLASYIKDSCENCPK